MCCHHCLTSNYGCKKSIISTTEKYLLSSLFSYLCCTINYQIKLYSNDKIPDG